jgi:FkbM family methyltransferase
MFYRLSRFSSLHRMFRAITYAVLWNLPDFIKWPALGVFLRFRLPYRLLKRGDLAVQIGAPWDLLKAGRSRGIHLSRVVGKTGKVIIVEPDPENVSALRQFVDSCELTNVIIAPVGAWSHKTRLRFLVDRANPAANLVEDVADTSRKDLGRFEVTEIEVDTIENILRQNGLSAPKLLSITTNGSENEILKGMKSLADGLHFIATIGDEAEIPMLKELGFYRYGGDDRGFTYINARFSQQSR